jgi:transposase
MSASAGEIEKAESRAKAKAPRQYTEEYRLEAAGHCRKAREADPKKSIRECASELGINDKTLNDWILKQAKTGRVTQERTGEQKELDEARKRIREPGSGSGFLKEAAAFFARSL